jgi:hypothetical protein
MNIFHFKFLLTLRYLRYHWKVSNDSGNSLARTLIRLNGTATILAFLTTAFDLGRFLQNALPTRLSLSMKKISVLGKILINSKFGAANANALENIHDHGVKLNIIDRTGQSIVSKVAGAAMIRLAAGAADFSIVQNTHAWIKQASNFWLISFISDVRSNLHYGAPFNLLRREDAELDAHDRLDIRRMLIETSWHSVLEIETVIPI